MRTPRLIGTTILVLTCLAGPARPSTPFLPPDNAVREVIGNNNFNWSTVRSDRFEIYYEAGTYPAGRLDFLKGLAEESLDRALDILGETEFPRGLRVFMVDTRDKMIPLTGSRPKGFTMVGDDAVILVFNENIRPYMRHEVFHAVSIALWGMPETWLREGAAVYADGMCYYADPFRTIPAWLVRSGNHVPLARLTGDFVTIAAQNDMATYMEAGGFVQYLFDTCTDDQIKRVWAEGVSAIPQIFGKPLEAVESDWLKSLEDVDTRVVDWEMLMNKGCG